MPGILCEHCTAVCCRYIALPIDEPTTRKELDDVRWYLLHEGVTVFVEDGEWYISFQTTCRHLQPDYRCGIYATRPRICREYSTDKCDYHSGDYGWEHHFTAPEHLEEYARTHLDGKKKKRGARRKSRDGNVKRKKPGDQNGRNSKGGAGKMVRSGPRVRLRPRRQTPHPHGNANGTLPEATDLRGIPLPVLNSAISPI